MFLVYLFQHPDILFSCYCVLIDFLFYFRISSSIKLISRFYK
nr:MAG TPA: hypothetical protein [Bacteriophage sp.]